MIPCAISLILISIIIPLIFRSKNTVSENDDKISFEFGKAFKIVMLVSTIVFISASIIFLVLSITSDNKGELIAVIFFALFAILSGFVYLLAKNKKIIYSGNVLYSYNIFGKQKSFNIADITEAVELPMDGMKLIFKDNSKLKIDMQMSNYEKVKEILSRNNITYKI